MNRVARTFVASLTGLPLILQAQAPPSSPDSDKTTERIVLAHPYYPTAESEGAVRVVVWTANFMEQGGANTPIEALRQLPFFVGTTRTENDPIGDGTASINLFALGAGNVLTLINGRRVFGFSDINSIPISALSRTELVDTGIYGSDSAAGMVNFILLSGPGEKPYEGAELHALYGNTTESDAHVRQVYMRGGVAGLNGKVAVAVAAEYYSHANLFGRDREILRNADPPNDVARSIAAIPAVEKAMFFAAGRYKVFGDGLQLYGDILHSKTRQDNAVSPTAVSLEEIGLRKSSYDRDSYRYVAGLNGDFNPLDNAFLSRFGYDAGIVYERSDQLRTDRGALTLSGFDIGHSIFNERDWLADVKFNAHLFPNLWNGGFDAAAGYERRQRNARLNSSLRQKFREEVESWFFELSVCLIPSTMNIPFVRSLDVDLTWRREQFNDVNLLRTANPALPMANSFGNRNPSEDFRGAPTLALRYQPDPGRGHAARFRLIYYRNCAFVQ